MSVEEQEAENIVDEDQKSEDALDSTEDSETNQEESEENGSVESDAEEKTEDSEEAPDTGESEEEVVVSIGEESPPQEESQEAPTWVKEVRKANRELKKQNRELQGKLDIVSGASQKTPVLGNKPKLEDFDYDTDKFEQGLTEWFDRKQQVENEESKVKLEQERQDKAWNDKLSTYNDEKVNLKVKDYDEAEHITQDALSTTQQGMIIQGADNPALVIYALGKNSKKLKELTDIKDPIKFAFAVSKLETKLNVSNRKRPASKPESIIKSTTTFSGSSDARLESLRSDAEKSGDYSKVMAYKSQLKRKK